MGTCDFCKVEPEEQLRSCVCKKVSYCSKECQAKDWKTHKPSCPPFIIRESPGKGRGLFATRKIKEGEIILEEYPLLTFSEGLNPTKFKTNYYPAIDNETKAVILKLNDPVENLKYLDTDTVEKLVRKDPIVRFWREAQSDEISKILRIITGNWFQVCGEEKLYDTNEAGLYNSCSIINHSCVPNAVWGWVMGDFKKKQVRAMKTIEKNQEILVTYVEEVDFVFGSREVRRQKLLEKGGFLCSCSECSLEGGALEDNDRMREEVMEIGAEIIQLLGREGSDPVPRGSLKKCLKLAQQRVKLTQKLDLRAEFVAAMIGFYGAATMAKEMDISILENDPDTFKQEALKYAKMFGDCYIYYCNQYIN